MNSTAGLGKENLSEAKRNALVQIPKTSKLPRTAVYTDTPKTQAQNLTK